MKIIIFIFCYNSEGERDHSLGILGWKTVFGNSEYGHLEKGISFALKGVGREQPEDPIGRFSQLLICFEKQPDKKL